MYRRVSFTEGELFDQFAYFFYHKAVTLEPLDFEDMVYTETEYPIEYKFLLETAEGGIYLIRIAPYGNGTAAEVDMYHEEEYRTLDRAYRIQLPLGMPFDSRVNHQYAWSEGIHPSELP